MDNHDRNQVAVAHSLFSTTLFGTLHTDSGRIHIRSPCDHGADYPAISCTNFAAMSNNVTIKSSEWTPVEVGRIVRFPKTDKIACIVDIIDHKRVCPDGSE